MFYTQTRKLTISSVPGASAAIKRGRKHNDKRERIKKSEHSHHLQKNPMASVWGIVGAILGVGFLSPKLYELAWISRGESKKDSNENKANKKIQSSSNTPEFSSFYLPAAYCLLAVCFLTVSVLSDDVPGPLLFVYFWLLFCLYASGGDNAEIPRRTCLAFIVAMMINYFAEQTFTENRGAYILLFVVACLTLAVDFIHKHL